MHFTKAQQELQFALRDQERTLLLCHARRTTVRASSDAHSASRTPHASLRYPERPADKQ